MRNAICLLFLVWTSPALAWTCADVQRGVALAGTTNPAELERWATAYGVQITPQRRRQALRCLNQGAASWGKKRTAGRR